MNSAVDNLTEEELIAIEEQFYMNPEDDLLYVKATREICTAFRPRVKVNGEDVRIYHDTIREAFGAKRIKPKFMRTGDKSFSDLLIAKQKRAAQIQRSESLVAINTARQAISTLELLEKFCELNSSMLSKSEFDSLFTTQLTLRRALEIINKHVHV